ncbi:hypothetical protein D3C74_22340 [compost metagenome]
MAQATTIRTELENYMELNALNISQLGKISGLNPGTISSILSGNKVIAVDQLDRITSVMKLEHGHFYEQYIEECLVNAPLNWRRVRPFLYRCAELGKLNCIEKAVALLIDNLTYSPLLFETAEDFFQDNKREAAAILYDVVASSERRQHSERLALCQYRLFSLRLGEDHSKNLQAAIQFEPFVERLDEIDQLDALKDLANTYRSLRHWDKVGEVAKEMGRKAEILYFMSQSSKRRRSLDEKKPSKLLFTYVAYAYLLQANVYDETGDYNQALQYIELYADLSWVKEDDPDTLHAIRLFESWAETNRLVVRLLSGDLSILDEYVQSFRSQKDELLTGLLNISTAANRHNFNIDYILVEFINDISELITTQETNQRYTTRTTFDRYIELMVELSKYYLNSGNYVPGFNSLISGLSNSVFRNKRDCILQFIKLFEQYNKFASEGIREKYSNIISNMSV